MISYEQSLKYIEDIQLNYTLLTNKIPLELDLVTTRLSNNLNSRKIKLIGKIPHYTLYNIGKTKKRILEVDEDSIIAIIGKAGKGKTNVSFIASLFLDKDFSDTRIIFTFDELLAFLKECSIELEKEHASNGTYKSKLRGVNIVIDEGVDIFFSTDVNTKKGKLITKLLTIIRFLNLMVFVNATNYEKLNKVLRESRLRGVIRLDQKGIISYFSPKKTNQIVVNSENITEYPEPSFTEQVGYIDKECNFWDRYSNRKSNYVSNTITDIQNIMKEVK